MLLPSREADTRSGAAVTPGAMAVTVIVKSSVAGGGGALLGCTENVSLQTPAACDAGSVRLNSPLASNETRSLGKLHPHPKTEAKPWLFGSVTRRVMMPPTGAVRWSSTAMPARASVVACA